nr:TraQ conjugal transfer family protein [Parabacteroides goldsteinii]
MSETAEVRFHLYNYYEETMYFIRYFQPVDKGWPRMANRTVFLPNDLYPLSDKTFRCF